MPENWIEVSHAEGMRCLRWLRNHEVRTPGVEIKVSTRPYSGRAEPEWVRVSGVLEGDTPYPIRGQVPGRGNGQWALADVQAMRIHALAYVPGYFPFPERLRHVPEGPLTEKRDQQLKSAWS